MITRLSNVFQSNRGDHTVDFEVLELETVKKQIEMPAPILIETEDSLPEEELSMGETPEINTAEVEETKIVTRLSMPSRKLKIKISNELLQELEKMQLNFKLN